MILGYYVILFYMILFLNIISCVFILHYIIMYHLVSCCMKLYLIMLSCVLILLHYVELCCIMYQLRIIFDYKIRILRIAFLLYFKRLYRSVLNSLIPHHATSHCIICFDVISFFLLYYCILLDFWCHIMSCFLTCC